MSTDQITVTDKPEFKVSEMAAPSADTFRYQQPKVEISEGDKEKFFKSFLADSPYTEEYLLFGGKAKVVFNTLTVAQNNEVYTQIKYDREQGVAKDDDSYLIRVITYRLGLGITSIEGIPFKKFSVPEDQQDKCTIAGMTATQFGKWNSFKLAAYLDAFRKFEAKVTQLTMAVHEPDFWKAAV